jgi:3-methyladenine DNA glycosylase/8-oxoguanine DNA glycosylase
MHWILTVSDSFSLTKVIQRSLWLLQPPFSTNRAHEQLYRVEHLASDNTVALTVTQAPAGLVLHTNEHLTSAETEEVSHKTWRMLRLGENLRPFLNVARRTPGLESTLRYGVTLLRGTTLFEDVIKALIFTWEEEAWQSQRIAWIVDRFGDPLPSNPTLHTFPTPQQMLWNQHLLEEMRNPPLAQCLIDIADRFHQRKREIETTLHSDLPLHQHVNNVQDLLNLDPVSLGMVMLCLGRYDYIPVDACAQARVSRQWYRGNNIGPEEVRATFEPYQPWGGLAYWLWDWSNNNFACQWLREEVTHGKLENQCRAS